jgi:hypothetical protein
MMTKLAHLMTRRMPLSWAAGLAAVAIVLTFAFMWATAGGGPAISESDAIDAAIAQVEADGVMTLDGRETVAEVEDGNWHVSFPLSIVPQVIWGDVDCNGAVEGPDALDVLRDAGGLDSDPIAGCPHVGTVIDPADICGDESCSTAPRGGEPHVIINGTDGSVEEVYYTQ